MGEHDGVPSPSSTDLRGRPVGQGDDRGCRGNEDVQLSQVQRAIGEVRVVQVVHRQHQRDVALAKDVDDLEQGVDGDGLEAEVHVQHVERADVASEVLGVQQPRRPPLAGHGRSQRNRIGQQGDARGVHHRLDVGVACRNRSHSQHEVSYPVCADSRRRIT